MPAEQAVGVIGLGLLGRAIAARLSAAGFDVLGYDRVAQAMHAFDGRATEDALRARRIVLAVFDTGDAEKVVAASSASVYVDCATGESGGNWRTPGWETILVEFFNNAEPTGWQLSISACRRK